MLEAMRTRSLRQSLDGIAFSDEISVNQSEAAGPRRTLDKIIV
jgi:hypothetical protein